MCQRGTYSDIGHYYDSQKKINHKGKEGKEGGFASPPARREAGGEEG